MKHNGLPQFELMPDFARSANAKPQLQTISRELPANLADVCMAALILLLARYSGETGVVIGTETGVLHIDVSDDPSWVELLKRVTDAPRLHTGIEPRIHFGPQDSVQVSDIHIRLTDSILSCEYDTTLYRSVTIDALLGHLERVHADAVEHPDRRVSDFSFLSPEEEHRLLVDWNATRAVYPRDVCIHQLLEESAAISPNSMAIQFLDHSLTFAEFDQRANQLAHYLAERGSGPGTIIGISLDRSMDMLVAVLAVLKTGAAYLPLDPAFPHSRLEFMASDAGIHLSITKELLASDSARIGTKPSTSLKQKADPESLAYVLYTSGSTGKPKGVEVSHRSVLNLLCAMQAHVQLSSTGSLLAVTTLSFDIAVLELFLPLLTGARIVLASREQTSDPIALRELMNGAKPTLMQATPGTWRMLIESGWTGSRDLKVLVGGEKVTRAVADALLERSSAVWNCYGPTETTVWSTICRLESDSQPISIGRPLANTTLYVLDANKKLVPIGAKGELYIGGDGVARGYRNQPNLTADRFSENPFGDGRLYRTGDLVRYKPDGQLEILGRNDAQVKVRGFRIELGDVENALAACPQVSAAAVVIREDATGESALAGYFVPHVNQEIDSASIRSFLAQRLPDYMIPTLLTKMAALPMTPNGKIDRNALPGPEAVSNPIATQSNSTLEDTLIGIWESTLGVRPINVTDNFFELGGHSVLAARIFARMEKALGKALPLATLFQAPTIAKLAAVIRKSDWKPIWSSLVPIRPAGTKPPFFFVHPIGGNVLNFSGFCSHFGPDQPIYGLQARGLNNEVAPHTSIEEMASDYIENIRGVQAEGPYYIGGFSAGGVVAFEMARQLQDVAQPVGILALLDTEILTLVQESVSLSQRLHAWWRMTKINLRYASRMTTLEYLGKKAFNLRMRRKLLALGVRERLGLTIDPSKLNAEEAFLLAFKRYVPQPFYGNATLFRAGDGAEYLDPKLGWAGIIRGYLDIQEVSGDHDTILQEPHIGMLAGLLETCLERAWDADPHQSVITHATAGDERLPGLAPAILGSREVIG